MRIPPTGIEDAQPITCPPLISLPLDASERGALLACVTARRPVYIAVGNYGPRSRLAKQALYAYVQVLGKPGMAYCRTDGSSTERGKPTAHMALVHQIQSLDPDDPWLQVEWGETMLQQGRVPEGTLHISAGGLSGCLRLLTLPAAAIFFGRL